MRPLYIFDLDGTIALTEHRQHLIRPPANCYAQHGGNAAGQPCECRGSCGFKPDWRAFFAACVHDQPNKPVIATLHSLFMSGAECWIWSGRSDEVRSDTVAWLREHAHFGRALLASMLRMRAAGDFTPDEVLKKQWLDAMATPDRERLVAIFDDRDKVVAMWRAAGVPCFQVAPGAF